MWLRSRVCVPSYCSVIIFPAASQTALNSCWVNSGSKHSTALRTFPFSSPAPPIFWVCVAEFLASLLSSSVTTGEIHGAQTGQNADVNPSKETFLRTPYSYGHFLQSHLFQRIMGITQYTLSTILFSSEESTATESGQKRDERKCHC